MPTARSQVTSLAIHASAIALLLFFTSHSFFIPPPPAKPTIKEPVLLAPPPKLIRIAVAERGGGSNTSPEPARRGVPPPRSTRTFIPPATYPDPKLPIPVTIDFDVPVVDVASSQIGDPFSKFGGPGLGNKGGNTIGNFPGGPTIGDDPGLRPSGRIGNPTKPAQLIYRVDPEFSEDARKAKFQGIVVLMIEVGTDGRAHNLRIIQTPGLGLDAKAVEAVVQWRFKPASRGNTPVASTARVEVYFHLL
jgi:periplasmic protein TonB